MRIYQLVLVLSTQRGAHSAQPIFSVNKCFANKCRALHISGQCSVSRLWHHTRSPAADTVGISCFLSPLQSSLLQPQSNNSLDTKVAFQYSTLWQWILDSIQASFQGARGIPHQMSPGNLGCSLVAQSDTLRPASQSESSIYGMQGHAAPAIRLVGHISRMSPNCLPLPLSVEHLLIVPILTLSDTDSSRSPQ